MVKFAQRTEWSLTTNKVTEVLQELKKNGVSVLDLTASNPTQCGFAYPKDMLKGLSSERNFQYEPEAQGLFKAREAVSRYYWQRGFKVSPDQIFLTSSTSEGYSYLFRLLANPGDTVFFPRPSYPLFQFLSELNDVHMKTYHPNDGCLGGYFCKEAKVIVVVNPNNPTGLFVQNQELEQINAFCMQNQRAIICDEVFWDYAFENQERPISLVDNTNVLTFVLGGLSKTLGLPQMKLSWIVMNGPDDLVKEAKARLELIADTYLSVNTPAQNALANWFASAEEIQQKIKERVLKNLEFLKKKVQECEHVELLNAEGGWYSILRVHNGEDEESFILSLLKEKHVLVHPGYFFDFNEESYYVISLLPIEEIFQEGVVRMLEYKV
ncbi:hypothetical protein MNBD_UNCLBAC01-86 [hydrothermal vent metagenome]|uniref:Aminotransferase class I/classII large domain-containing protein n=1 Tax=hydrothermal vent metagenome TaxID=652676 RepID=A0A3B1DKG6_9ZZZZ